MKVRSIAILSVVVLVLAVLPANLAGEDEYHNCAICKPMATEPGLMENMHWESHTIATGMLSVTTVKPEYEEAYSRAHAKMMQAVEKLEAGEELELCPFCQRMNALAKAGAQMENVEAQGSHILAVTSDKPEVIEKIHAYAEWIRNQMQQAQAG